MNVVTYKSIKQTLNVDNHIYNLDEIYKPDLISKHKDIIISLNLLNGYDSSKIIIALDFLLQQYQLQSDFQEYWTKIDFASTIFHFLPRAFMSICEIRNRAFCLMKLIIQCNEDLWNKNDIFEYLLTVFGQISVQDKTAPLLISYLIDSFSCFLHEPFILIFNSSFFFTLSQYLGINDCFDTQIERFFANYIKNSSQNSGDMRECILEFFTKAPYSTQLVDILYQFSVVHSEIFCEEWFWELFKSFFLTPSITIQSKCLKFLPLMTEVQLHFLTEYNLIELMLSSMILNQKEEDIVIPTLRLLSRIAQLLRNDFDNLFFSDQAKIDIFELIISFATSASLKVKKETGKLLGRIIYVHPQNALNIFLEFGSSIGDVENFDIFSLPPSIPQIFEILLEVSDEWLNDLLISGLSRMSQNAKERNLLENFGFVLNILNTFSRLHEIIDFDEDSSDSASAFLEEYFPDQKS